MDSGTPKRIVVVLGMHRSGTSAITRALTVTGIALGNRIGPPGPDNEMGYWEDLDIYQLNVELLQALGRDWYTLAPLEREQATSSATGPFLARAVGLLREKISPHQVFGLKDPRIAVLLPFWKRAFEQLHLDVKFVIALRNPMSVAQSLLARNGFAVEKSYYLWLMYVVLSVIESRGYPRVVVDYDRLMDDPNSTLRHLTSILNLEIDDLALKNLIAQFLQDRLRHTRFQGEDLVLDASIPSEVREAFSTLDRCAREGSSLEQPEIETTFLGLQQRLKDLAPALCYMSRTDSMIDSQAQTAVQRDQQIEVLQGKLAERKAQVTALERTLANQVEVVKDQAEVVKDQAEVVKDHAKTVADQVRQISTLRLAIEESRGRTATLMKEHHSRISGLIDESERRLAGAEHAHNHDITLIDAQNAQITALSQQTRDLTKLLAEHQSSMSWRITMPARVTVNALRQAGSRAVLRMRNRRERA